MTYTSHNCLPVHEGGKSSVRVAVRAKGEQSFNSNGLRFATADEAAGYAQDLFCRWTAVEAWRLEDSDDAVNYRFYEGRAERIEA